MNETRETKVAAAKERMIELAAKFVDRTAKDLAIMRSSLDRLATGDACGLDEMRHLAHRMAGTGATLGFEGLSDFALRVELLVDGFAPDSVPDGTALAELRECFGALEAEFTRVRTQPH